MILIKFLSIILLLPSISVARKLINKAELNFFDLLIVFNTLFFVIIPLKSNQAVYNVIGRLSTGTSIFVFFYLLFFFIAALIASNLIEKKNNTPINVTYFLKNYPNLRISLVFKIFLIVLPIFSIVYYIPQMSLMTAFKEIQQESANASYEQSSMVKLFATIFRFGLIIPMMLFFQNLKKKKYDILIAISLALFMLNYLMLSRRELLEFLLFGGIVFYSTNRELINKKLISYAFIFAAFLYFIYFPFYNIVRTSPIEFKVQQPITSIQNIYNYGVDKFDDANEGASESTDTRAINLYKAIYWVARNDGDHDITWGSITLSAIDHAIPKVLNPNKGLGSEITLQDRQNVDYDSADSVLLLTLADYSTLGSIITVLFYILIYRLWLFISRSSEFFFGKTIVSLYVVYSVFSLAFATEQKLDGILAKTVSFTLVIALIILIHKFNFIKIITIKKNSPKNYES
ncbi:Oligosaccharide repeat unit polymerase [Zobellia nedashkovskayae]